MIQNKLDSSGHGTPKGRAFIFLRVALGIAAVVLLTAALFNFGLEISLGFAKFAFSVRSGSQELAKWLSA